MVSSLHASASARRTVVLVLALLACIGVATARAGALVSVAPMGASPGVTINITGTGFDPLASNNEVVFVPPSGAPVTAPGVGITLLNAASGLRRLSLPMPTGLPVGTIALRVRNTRTGELSEGKSIELVQIQLQDVVSGAPGANHLIVRITGSANSQFVAGSSRAVFGAGITVHATTVESGTSLRADISIAGTAALGPRTVGVITSTQTLQLANAFSVVQPGPALQSISVAPVAVRFTEWNVTRPLTVTGHYSDGTTKDLTLSATGTTYVSSNPFVARVNTEGNVTSLANGELRVTAHNGQLSAPATVVVEQGVSLQALELTPSASVLRAAGATVQVSVAARYSDGSTRDVTPGRTGTTYDLVQPGVATISGDGLVTAAANGTRTVVATHEGLTAQGQITVAISSGNGFFRGEVYDDTRGLPLGGATVTVMEDGSGPLALPFALNADDRGQFTIAARSGQVIVRISKPGFTSVERRGEVPDAGVIRLLDTRLTPLDARSNEIGAAFGGEARSASAGFRTVIPPGALQADTVFHITPISNQGLAGRLPTGWSPLAGVDVSPDDRQFGQTVALHLPNALKLAAGTSIVVGFYDRTRHQWTAVDPATVSADGAEIVAPLHATGQYALLVPDTTPSAPPVPQQGEPLLGVNGVTLPAGPIGTSQVVPRSAPPGDGARAVGTIVLQTPGLLPSGTVVEGHVNETFDLLNASRVVPQPFTQDLVAYAQPRIGDAGTVGTRFPITPSRTFTIQELLLGKVTIQVAPPVFAAGNIVGAAGGTVVDAAGDSVVIPAGALAGESVVDVRRLSADQLTFDAPDGFELLGATLIDVAGATLLQGAALSITRSSNLPDSSQVVVVQAIADPSGIPRLRVVAIGELQPNRIVTLLSIPGVNLPGVRTGGQYAFLRTDRPLAFVTGTIGAPAGGPQAGAVITTNTAPFADVTGSIGTYLVAARAGEAATITARHVATNATVAGSVTAGGLHSLAQLNLALGVVVPTVASVSPPAGASGVPLNAPVVVQFSEPMDVSTIVAANLSLRAGASPVSARLTLSADQRAATLRADAELASNTEYTLVVSTGLRSVAGHALATFAPVTFRTLDTSKPAQPAAGQITAELPDETGFVLVAGTLGTAAASTAVTATNLRTQETITVRALTDGSFRLRLAAAIGDELALTLRDATDRELTVAITQFEDPDGTTAVGPKGGTIKGPNATVGRILDRALADSAVLRIANSSTGSSLPLLPTGFRYIETFELSFDGGPFNRLRSLTLSEGQNRFVPLTGSAEPFETAGTLVVPGDFLVNGTLKFSAVAQDVGGDQHSVAGATQVVDSNAGPDRVETGFGASFPTVFLQTAKEALRNQQVEVEAIAPAARVEIELPAPTPPVAGETFLLARVSEIGGELHLALVDRFQIVDVGGHTLLRTSGRNLPGLSSAGRFVVVGTIQPLAFVKGQIAGPSAGVVVEGSPIGFEATGANASFIVPVAAGQPFTLTFVDAGSGQVRGTSTGQAPASGTYDAGSPLGVVTGALSVTAQPGFDSIVDIGTLLVFTFSEPIDERTLAANILVSDANGIRAFGTFSLSDSRREAVFTPLRRWRYGTRYRYAVSRNVLALSGARLAQAFTGEFTTFSPRTLSSTSIDAVRDVAVSGSLAVTADAAGLTLLDVSQPEQPVTLGDIALPGGAGGVKLLNGASLTDRNGQTIAGNLAVVVGGGETTRGVLQVLDVNTPGSPAVLGTAQLTVAPGESPPAGVPNTSGVPRAVVVTPSARAIAAVREVGVESINLSEVIPDTPTQPGVALGPRYPAAGFESADDVALVEDRILAAGSAGLTILDSTTLQKIGNVATAGNARGVAGLSAFRMDVNGNGAFDPAADVFDLAVVANGADGTLQFFDIRNPASPKLISLVRLGGDATGVVLNREENLAYVGTGARGLQIVDLTGPASIQPLDLDRNGIDDRVLGTVLTPGSAGRLAMNLARGVGYVADGSRGLTVVQLIPPRTAFESVMRDPFAGSTGDEQSIVETRQAFTTDEGITVSVNAVVPPQTALFLTVDEVPDADGARLLAFADGSTSAPLVNGATVLSVRVNGGPASPGSRASLRIRDAASRVLATFDLRIDAPALSTLRLESLFVVPQALQVGIQETSPLAVGGLFSDGRSYNLTSAGAGTTYRISESVVASVSNEGVVTGLAGGQAVITAVNGPFRAQALVTVNGPPVLAELIAAQPRMTLTNAATPSRIRMFGRLSDGRTEEIGFGAGTTFESSDPTIVDVSATGELVALRDGVVTVTVRNGTFQQQIQVAVDARPPASVAAIEFAPVAGPVTTDTRARLQARVIGTGALEGLTVMFSSAGTQSFEVTGTTDYQGVAQAMLRTIGTPGTLTVRATVVDPASASTREDTTPLVVTAGSGDHEPNDSTATAPRLQFGRPIAAAVGPADSRDVYRLDPTTDGSHAIEIRLPDGVNPANATVRVLDAAGSELARFVPTTSIGEFVQPVSAGPSYLAVETTGASVAYTLMVRFKQAPITVSSVSPTAGGPGTLVTITGSGFSTALRENVVTFGRIAGKVVAAEPGRLDVRVPANAGTGPIGMIVGALQVAGPQFTTSVSPPPPFADPATPNMKRLDPVSGTTVVVNRVHVYFDPLASRADVDQVAARAGARVSGFMPPFNSYVFDFDTVRTIAALEARRAALRSESLVRFTTREAVYRPVQLFGRGLRFDTLDQAGTMPGTSIATTVAYAQIRIYEALKAIRQSAPFTTPNFRQVKVAILDTGLADTAVDHVAEEEFTDGGGVRVEFIDVLNASAHPADPNRLAPGLPYDGDGHGTTVASIYAALNDGRGRLNGILFGLLQPGESLDDVPLEVIAYRVLDKEGDMAQTEITKALTDIYYRGDIDVVNMSFAQLYNGYMQDLFDAQDAYADALRYMPTTLFVAGAGNTGVDTGVILPASIAALSDNVMSVGGVAVANRDRTGEQADARAIYAVPPELATPPILPGFPSWLHCGSGAFAGSNCGPTVTLAAPGEDIFAIDDSDYGVVAGTSYAAPLVGAVAAVLQAIKTEPSPIAGFTPRELKDLLVDTGDDISDTWDLSDPFRRPGTIRRLNALAAVLAVLPPPDFRQFAYITDELAEDPQGTAATGAIVAIDFDPLTGERAGPTAPDRAIGPVLSFGTTRVTAQKPSTVAVSPAGEKLYVVAESPMLGHGLIAVNTYTFTPEGFIPLSGEEFPGPATGPPPAPRDPVRLATNRPGMVFSPDGRVLYVATNDTITIVNTASNKVVERLADLPAPYNVLAGTERANALYTQRYLALAGFVTAPLHGPNNNVPGQYLTNLAISPDGKTLYAVVQLPGITDTGQITGGVRGNQPGVIIPIDVDLYKDKEPNTPGLQSDLSNYFHIRFPILKMPGTVIGDEPKGLTVAPDGKHLYFVNGGVNYFQGQPPAPLDLAVFFDLLMGPLAGIAFHSAGLSGGAQGVLQGMANSEIRNGNQFVDLSHALEEQINSGITIISAPGFTGIFSVAEHFDRGGTAYDPSTYEWLFPSDLPFGWNPQDKVSTHLHYPSVFTSRPFGMSIRPDGRRALVPYFQSGNFGVLDLDGQEKFETAPPAVPDPNVRFGFLDEAMFHGVVGTTTSLQMDNHIWPSRGRPRLLVPGGSSFFDLPSPDEALLFTWDLQYAQNGRFAVATHSGTGKPPGTLAAPQVVPSCPSNGRDACGQLPNFISQQNAIELFELGLRPNVDVFPQNYVAVPSGGGAISVIKDSAIDADFTENLVFNRVMNDTRGRLRAYYSVNPICEKVAKDVNGNPLLFCEKEAATHRLGYSTAQTPFRRFAKPKGVAIQPFVTFEDPRYGDVIEGTRTVQIRWRDSRIDGFELRVSKIDPVTGETTSVGLNAGTLTAEERAKKTLNREFRTLFILETPTHLQKYRIKASVFVSGETQPLSTTTIDVTAEKPPVRLTAIRVIPDLESTRVGRTVHYRAAGSFSDGHIEDLTASATWQSSAPTIASIVPGGVATGVAGGQTLITASRSGVTSDPATLRVVVLQSIEVTPQSVTTRVGRTTQFRAEGVFTDGSRELLTTTATWRSSTPSIAAISVGGTATALAGGTTNITATEDGITSNAAALRVLVLVSIDVTPQTASVSTGGTQPFRAVGVFNDSSREDPLQNAVWASSDPAVATIDATGLATAALVLGLPSAQTTMTAAAQEGSTTVTSSGAQLTVVSTPAGSLVVINELVVQPQRDWNDSGAGGDGVPFNATPGSSVAPAAAVTLADQWIELANSGSPVDLSGWTLTLTTGGVPVVIPLAAGVLGPGQVRVIGAPVGLTTATTVTLTDNAGVTRDTADLTTVHAAVGFATSVGNEAVRRVPGGGPTSFVRGVATIGQPF